MYNGGIPWLHLKFRILKTKQMIQKHKNKPTKQKKTQKPNI